MVSCTKFGLYQVKFSVCNMSDDKMRESKLVEEQEDKNNTLAMLRLIADGQRDIASGDTLDKDEAFRRVRAKLTL